MDGDYNSVSLYHLIKIYGRWIDTMDGVYIFYTSFPFLYIGAFESERDLLCICPTSVGGAQDTMLAVRATGHNLDQTRLHVLHDLNRFTSPSSQSSLLSSPTPPPCTTFTALTTHNGSTAQNTPNSRANPGPLPPSPSFILPLQTSTISTSLHPLHHK